MKQERRQSPRFSLDQMIELGFDRERYVGAEAVNASEGGILCRTSIRFDRYAKVFMMLSLPGDKKVETIQCEGVVVRSEESGDFWETAINITIMSEKDRMLFAEYLQRTRDQESL